MGYIYRLRCKITGKVYVGQTIQKDVRSRWNRHKCVSVRFPDSSKVEMHSKQDCCMEL